MHLPAARHPRLLETDEKAITCTPRERWRNTVLLQTVEFEILYFTSYGLCQNKQRHEVF